MIDFQGDNIPVSSSSRLHADWWPSVHFIQSLRGVSNPNTTSNYLFLRYHLGPLMHLLRKHLFSISLYFLWTQVSRASYYFLDMPQIIRSHVGTCHLSLTQDANPPLVSTSSIHPSSSPECTRTFGRPHSLRISHGSYVKEIDIFPAQSCCTGKKALREGPPVIRIVVA